MCALIRETLLIYKVHGITSLLPLHYTGSNPLYYLSPYCARFSPYPKVGVSRIERWALPSKLNMHSTRDPTRSQQRRQTAIKLPHLTVVNGNVASTGQKPSLAPSKPASRRDRKRVPGNKAGGRGTSISVRQEVLEPLRAVKLKSKSPRQRNRTVSWPSIQYKLWLEASSLPYGGLQERAPCKTRLPCRKDDGAIQKPRHLSGAQRPASREHKSKTNLQAVSGETDSGREEVRRLGSTLLPSRMGQSSLESYLQSYQVNGKFGSQKSVFTVNPLTYRPLSGLHCQLLELKTHTRCPTHHHHLAADAQYPERKLQQSVHPPLSDTTPPPSPPSLNSAYKVTTYVSCHPN